MIAAPFYDGPARPPDRTRRLLSADDLLRARIAASPRLTPVSTPWRSVVIHAAIIGVWALLFARAFGSGGVLGWSVGLVYIGYDTALLAFVFARTLPLARAPIAAPPPAVHATLGVVIAARDEALVLPVTLAALFDQSDPPDQIILADDGSSDGTARLLHDSYGLLPAPLGVLGAAGPREPRLRWLRLPPGGKPTALNAALLVLDCDLVMTVDADTVLERGAVAAMRAAFGAEPRLVAATGLMAPACGPGLAGRLFEWFQTYEYLRNFLSRYAWARSDSLLLISGAFAAFRRDAVVTVGGFDTDCLVEDYELIHRLRRYGVLQRTGWTTTVVGAARAVTEAPGSLSAFLRQRRRWFGGFLQTQYWYRDMVGSPRYGLLGTLMLPVKAADTWQPIYGLTAAALAVIFCCMGQFDRINPIAGVIGLKLAADIGFHLWGIHLYRRWAGDRHAVSYGVGLAASLLEPFSFQLLRHFGAALGWVTLLSGRRQWGTQQRQAAVARPTETPPRL